MTTTTDRPRSKSSGQIVAGAPHVNLLPPEVAASRGMRRVRAWCFVVVALVVLAIGAFYVLSLWQRNLAQEELVGVQNRTADLQSQIQAYAEVPEVLGKTADLEQARQVGMSTEVLWKPYLAQITAALPAGVSLESITVSGATPMMAPAPPGDPLQQPSIGQIAFTGSARTVLDVATIMTQLNSVPGFSDAWVTTATLGEQDGVVSYTVSGTVQFTSEALEHRFDADEEGK